MNGIDTMLAIDPRALDEASESEEEASLNHLTSSDLYSSPLGEDAPPFSEAFAFGRQPLFDVELLDEKVCVEFRKYADAVRKASAQRKSHAVWCGVHKHLADVCGWPDAETGDAPSGNWDKRKGRLVHAEVARAATDVRWKPTDMHLHRVSRMVIRHLAHREWEMLDADVPIWSFDKRHVCTEADLICLDRTGKRIILIELKTGYDQAYDKRLSECVIEQADGEQIGDTKRTRTQMQLGWMVHHLRARLPADVQVDGVVLRASLGAGVRELEWLDERIERHFANAYPVPKARGQKRTLKDAYQQ